MLTFVLSPTRLKLAANMLKNVIGRVGLPVDLMAVFMVQQDLFVW